MPVAETGRGRNRSLDRLDEVAGPLERFLLPAPDDRLRDLPRIPLLAVALEDDREVPLCGLVDDSGRGDVRGRIRAHVERRVGRVREATVRAIDLHRRDAEVEQDRIRL